MANRVVFIFLLLFTVVSGAFADDDSDCSDFLGWLSGGQFNRETLVKIHQSTLQNLSFIHTLEEVLERTLSKYYDQSDLTRHRQRFVAAREKAEEDIRSFLALMKESNHAEDIRNQFFDEPQTTQSIRELSSLLALQNSALLEIESQLRSPPQRSTANEAIGFSREGERGKNITKWINQTEKLLLSDDAVPFAFRQFVQIARAARIEERISIGDEYISFIILLADKAQRLHDPSVVDTLRAEELLKRQLEAGHFDALTKAHRIGPKQEGPVRGLPVFTFREISEKNRILVRAGFTPKEIETLLVERIAGAKFRYIPNQEYSQQIAKLHLTPAEREQIRKFKEQARNEGAEALLSRSDVHELERELLGLFALEIGGSSSPNRLLFQPTPENFVEVKGVGDHSIYSRLAPKRNGR